MISHTFIALKRITVNYDYIKINLFNERDTLTVINYVYSYFNASSLL